MSGIRLTAEKNSLNQETFRKGSFLVSKVVGSQAHQLAPIVPLVKTKYPAKPGAVEVVCVVGAVVVKAIFFEFCIREFSGESDQDQVGSFFFGFLAHGQAYIFTIAILFGTYEEVGEGGTFRSDTAFLKCYFAVTALWKTDPLVSGLAETSRQEETDYGEGE